MDDAFGIRACRECVAAIDKLLTKFRVVVNLAIEHHPNPAVFVRDRLVSASNVYDAEPAEAEADSWSYVNTFVVRAAMNDRIGHSPHELLRDLFSAFEFKDAADSAHAD